MKKLFLVVPLVILLCFAFGCEKEGEEAAEEAMETQALTDAQVMEIEAALKNNYEQYLAAMMEMNVDSMMAYYSDTDFQEVLMGIDVFTSKDSFKNMFIEMIEGRESHGLENLQIKVFVLSPDRAYVSASYDYTINYENGRVFEGKCVQTSIWKMETDSWKITHDHFSWAGKFLEE
jgi:ketosteroid isomerase-like protein